ncbi:Uma2 family endonuclease [Gloeobacter morelensis MG652769]|uniref:Uma2 family endonuclease n=1 Tax=Gloeobacter morelensis MG652769 TaxID=2781736 RepID=A0ABY3PTC4_9CYAN|nr:Uma2 family endonuclease [Gloeobacter morelensis MG652769]
MTRGAAGSGIRWTTRDLEVLPENEWIRYEIIDGELFVARAPHRKHQQVCVKIARQLDSWSEASGLGEVVISPGIIFSDTDNVIPDLVWVSRSLLTQTEDEAGHLTAAPELVIEVLSAGPENLRRDREAKLKLYSLKGVREYWIVDRFARQLEVYRRDKAQLVLVITLLEEDEITSPLLPGFGVTVSKFLV